MISYNVRTEFSMSNGNIGSYKEVIKACEEKNITPAFADINNFFVHYKTKKHILGFQTYLITQEQVGTLVKHMPTVSLYARNRQGLVKIRKLYSTVMTAYKVYRAKKDIDMITSETLYSFLHNYTEDVFAIMLYKTAALHMLDGLGNVFFEWGQNDFIIREKSLWTQNNTYAFPSHFIPHQIFNHDQYGRDRNEVPYIMSLEETNNIAQKRGYIPFTRQIFVECDLDYHEKPKIPVPQTKPKNTREVTRLFDKLKYKQRLRYEIGVLKKKNFLTYIFLVADIIKTVKEHGIVVGVGRGSACGSLLCYALGITDIDPIKYGLLFERFINEYRDEPPDIDIDFSERTKVYDIIKNRYKYVVKLGSIQYLKRKSSIDRVSRAFALKLDVANNLKTIINDEGKTFEELLEKSKLIKMYPFYEHALSLENRCSGTGTHAGGYLLFDKSPHNYVSYNKETGVAQIDKYLCEEYGMLKIDCLGVTALPIICDCLQRIDMNYTDFINIIKKTIDTNNEPFEELENNNFHGIFQCEGTAVKSVLASILFNQCKIDFNLLCVVTSVSRVGGLQSGIAFQLSDAIKRKPNPTMLKSLRETYGFIVYQEQIMKICELVGGFNIKEQNEIRKIVSKGTGDMSEYEAKFKENKGIKKNQNVNALWQQIKHTGAYAFNKSHAVAYSYISYMTLWLKHYYKKEFYCAVLNHTLDVEKKTMIINEAKKNGITVGEVAYSTSWECEDNVIKPSLQSIRGFSDKKAQMIINRGRMTEKEQEKANKGCEMDIIQAPEFKRIQVIQDACPLFSKDDHFVLTGKILHKRMHFANSPERVSKRDGFEFDVDKWEGKGYFIEFLIYTGYYVFKVKSNYQTTTQRMLTFYKVITNKDLITFRLVNNGVFGFVIKDLKFAIL